MFNPNKNFFKGEEAVFEFINPENYYTPLVEIPSSINVFKKEKINIFVKLSWFNPLLNVKLIPAYWMFKQAWDKGKLEGVRNLIESSSGNMAYSLKILSKFFNIKNFKALISNQVSSNKRKILDILGIKYKVIEEDICPDPDDPNSSINIAKSFRNKKGWYNLGQYDNDDNYWGHYFLTGKQIYEQIEGDIDIVAIGLGTTGTLIGVSKYLKEKNPKILIVGVIREKNNLVPGVRTINLLKEISFQWNKYLDFKIFVNSKESYSWSLKLIRSGLFCGPSSGFALAGLIKFIKENFSIIKERIKDKGYINAIFVAPDTFLPYLDDYFEVLKIRNKFLNNKKENQKLTNIQKITSDELLKILNSKEKENVLIDIRNEYRFKDAHIPGSINVPYLTIIRDYRDFITKLNGENIILICDYGVKSEAVARFLSSKFKNKKILYLEGGIAQWSIKNYPREGKICFSN